jgi:hypothetical protein
MARRRCTDGSASAQNGDGMSATKGRRRRTRGVERGGRRRRTIASGAV